MRHDLIHILDDANALKCELACEVLRSSGTLRLRVTGWSMLPTVWPGDTLTIDRIHRDAVSEGDIVLFGRDRRFFVHRVVTKSEPHSELVTRGDAMSAPDPPVSETALLGRVSSILRNGVRIEARRSLRFSEHAIAAVVRHSIFAARVVVGVHGVLLRSRQSQVRGSQVQALRVQTSPLQPK